MAVCYMDDRSFWSNTSQCALVQINAWAAWSQIVGLKESAHKTQLVVKCSADEQFLRENHPSWFVQEATILGISTTTTVRKSTENEFNRIQRAKKRAALLLVTPLVWGLKVRAFQSMVVSMAAYGWVGKNPTVEMGDSLFNLLTKWLNTGKGASRELRKFFMAVSLGFHGLSPKEGGAACTGETDQGFGGTANPTHLLGCSNNLFLSWVSLLTNRGFGSRCQIFGWFSPATSPNWIFVRCPDSR